MSEFAIQLRNVGKSFGSHQVLKDLELSVPNKSIFAFLGNNGEGKSTAIRLIVGLLKPDRGSVEVLGRDILLERQMLLCQIGCLVEAPSAYPNLTAKEFLSIAASLKALPNREIARVLDLVGLQSVNQCLIRHFSLGMKQRLALAHALMGRPKLLILDEPTNGLDPSGTQEIRELIRQLPMQAECTVFVSSHQLDEVEKIATHVALLRDGRLQFQSRLDAISTNLDGALTLEVDDAECAAKILNEHAFVSHVISSTQLMVAPIAREMVHQVNACVLRANLRLHSSRFEKLTLERWFHQQMHRSAV